MNQFTFVSSASLNTYVNLFSLRGRVELAVFPALPTRCIAETTRTKVRKINDQQINIIVDTTMISQK